MFSSALSVLLLLSAVALANLPSTTTYEARAPEIYPPGVFQQWSPATKGRLEAPGHILSDVLAGVSLFSNNGTYTLVSTHIHIPDIHPSPDHAPLSAAYTWSGIDGIGCGPAALQAGLHLIATEEYISYEAWYRWYPGPLVTIEDISLRPGDDLQFILLTATATSGYVTVINESSGESFYTTIAGSPLCQQSAGWMVERAPSSIGLLPLPDFDSVNYTMSFASIADGSIVDPSLAAAVTYDIVQNGMKVTETIAGLMNATIRYIQ